MGNFSKSRNFLLEKNNQKGQVLLLVVLAAVVSLTVGLAAVSRSITNTKISTDEANSQEALSAAEAGVEKLLHNSSVGNTGPVSFTNDSKFNATVSQIRSSIVEVGNGDIIRKNQGGDIWLSDSNFSGGQWSGDLSIYWTNNSGNCNENAAIEIAIIRGTDKNNPVLDRRAYGVYCSGRIDNFDPPSLGPRTHNGITYNQGFTVNITNGYIARVIPAYADTRILAVGSNLPAQGITVDSVGTSGNTSRKISAFQVYPAAPIEFFPYSLFMPL